MTMPDVWLEIAFRKDAADGSPLWHDVSDDVEWQEGVRIARRRSHELDEIQPGTLGLVLDNPDGRYTAGNVSSPHYPYVKINRPVRVRARWPVSANLVHRDQASSDDAALFDAAAGTLAVDFAVFPPAHSSSIRWDTGVLGATNTHMWLGASDIATATDQGVPVVGGSQYALQVQARRGTTTISINARIRWYDASGTFLSASTGSTVALTTSFQMVSVAATAPANAVWARLAIANATTTASNANVYTGAWQFEQAATPTAWLLPGTEYIQYQGFTDKWPHAWENGVRGKVQLTATDRMKLLSRQRISREALISETLASSPALYYPCTEPENATAAGNRATTPHPDAAIFQSGTGGTVTFGAPEGPLGSAIVDVRQANGAGGKCLLAQELTPLGGTTAMTMAAWFVCSDTSPGYDRNMMFYFDDGVGVHKQMISYNYGSDHVEFWSQSNGTASGGSFALNLRDGVPHHVLFIAQFSGGFCQQMVWIDGVQHVNTGTGIPGTTWSSTFTRMMIGGGGWFGPISELWNGYVGQVAAWNRALTTSEIAALYDAGAASTELAGARISRVLAWAGVTDTAVDSGESLLDISAYGTSGSSLSDIREAALSDGGVFFIARDGVSTFHDRDRRQAVGNIPVITLAADQCGPDLDFIIDDTLLFNDITVARRGTSTRVTDDDSIDEYGQYTTSIQTVLASDTDAIQRGQYMLSLYADPSPRAGQVTVEARSKPTLWPSLLAADIGHRLSITGLPGSAPSATLSLSVEGVAQAITDATWTFTLDTSPGQVAFTLDDPDFGVLDQNRLGW